MNPRTRYHILIGTLIVLFGIATVRGATDNADAHATVAKAHASIKAYPTAVISLKDPKTETIFYVESSGRRLVALSKNGVVLWIVDVIEATKAAPFAGAPVIRRLELRNGELSVTFGKHSFATVGIGDGKVKYLGSD